MKKFLGQLVVSGTLAASAVAGGVPDPVPGSGAKAASERVYFRFFDGL